MKYPLKINRKIILIALIIVCITIVSIVGAFSVNKDNNEKVLKTSTPTITSSIAFTPAPTPLPTTTITPTVTIDQTSNLKTWYVRPDGNDSSDGSTEITAFKTIQKALDMAQSESLIQLAPGVYVQDAVSKTAGVTISGPQDAVVKGAGGARVLEIRHDNIVLKGFTIDGKHSDGNSKDSYRDKLVYVQGSEPKDGVSGLKILNMTITNAGGECVRLRYFVTGAEIAYNTITNCGRHDYQFDDGGKNGEGVYIGTAPEQRGDGKNPTSDPDESNSNHIHNNTFNTQGNECVDIKEDSKYNIVENNSCTGQKDSNSGGMDSRGGYNVFRYNEIFDNLGAGVRLGGDTVDMNINNDVYDNIIRGNNSGGIKFQAKPQGKICGNKMENNENGNAVGSYGSEFDPIKSC